ncbi:hypothetical protein [Thalassospira australica]|uniref:hypothetical protein n=1 Tax=Thalassospira australica TaxID=1528106 RepID=UPI00138E2396|nr:hypothetical protein [Thalassospira australica]
MAVIIFKRDCEDLEKRVIGLAWSSEQLIDRDCETGMANDKNHAIYYAKYISHHLAVKASRVNACPQMTLFGRFEPYLQAV